MAHLLVDTERAWDCTKTAWCIIFGVCQLTRETVSGGGYSTPKVGLSAPPPSPINGWVPPPYTVSLVSWHTRKRVHQAVFVPSQVLSVSTTSCANDGCANSLYFFVTGGCANSLYLFVNKQVCHWCNCQLSVFFSLKCHGFYFFQSAGVAKKDVTIFCSPPYPLPPSPPLPHVLFTNIMVRYSVRVGSPSCTPHSSIEVTLFTLENLTYALTILLLYLYKNLKNAFVYTNNLAHLLFFC